MNIYKLLGGVGLTAILVLAAPYAAAQLGLMAPLADKAWLILLVAAVGLLVKTVTGDIVAGEFQFYKFGYDNCVMTFGATLTALALQLTASGDLFPGLSSVVLLKDIPRLGTEDAANRAIQLFVFLLLSLGGMLIASAISAAIKKNTAKGPNFLSLLNSLIGTTLLAIYVLILITKG
jgi:hypothetical protein